MGVSALSIIPIPGLGNADRYVSNISYNSGLLQVCFSRGGQVDMREGAAEIFIKGALSRERELLCLRGHLVRDMYK